MYLCHFLTPNISHNSLALREKLPRYASTTISWCYAHVADEGTPLHVALLCSTQQQRGREGRNEFVASSQAHATKLTLPFHHGFPVLVSGINSIPQQPTSLP
jgi:hypothetical protein